MKLFSLFLIFLLSFSVFAIADEVPVARDKGGEWRINTFSGDDFDETFPYAIHNKVWDEGQIVYDFTYGVPDSVECSDQILFKDFMAAFKADLYIELIRGVLGDGYVISVGVCICNLKWFVVYVHDHERWGTREEYDRIWELLKSNQ